MEDSVKLYLRLKKKGKSHRSVIDRNKLDVYEIEATNPISFNTIGGSIRNYNRIKKEMIGLLVSKMNST